MDDVSLADSACRSPLGAGLVDSRGAILCCVLFSVVINLLMLTSPLYMLQIYDRVLVARSVPTLVALSLLMVFCFVIMGLLDLARMRLLARLGARLQARLEVRVMSSALARLRLRPGDPVAQAARHDLDTLAQFWSSGLVAALCDLPWTPLFLMVLSALHPQLGLFATLAAALLLALTLLQRRQSARPAQRLGHAHLACEHEAETLLREAETLRALGMQGHAIRRWQGLRAEMREAAATMGAITSAHASTSRMLRLCLQSAILGLGAWLVLQGQLGGGAMIAGSILMGRALQPIEATIGQWVLLGQARLGARRLTGLLTPEPAAPLPLPRPEARLEVEGLMLTPPGQPDRVLLREIGFQLHPGEVVGLLGASGAGKSALARALVGAWVPAAGQIRLGGASLAHYPPETLGRHLGYLPQRVSLLDGSIAENIARLDPDASPAQIVAASQCAGAHAMILALPHGYATQITAPGHPLSGGQIQRIGLARAFCAAPVVLVLDEPDAHLDTDGMAALAAALAQIRSTRSAALIIAHRHETLACCDRLLLLRDGQLRPVLARHEARA